MHAKDLSHNRDVPLVDRETWHLADGFIFACPTRFGMMAAQMKAFFDSLGQLWQAGGLVGKPAGWISGTGTQNGGQETTIFTSITQLVHLGMIFVPLGYTFGKLQYDNSFVHGVSPYGVSTLAG
jgi:NAD(P)H dehydrogenase (quinone)